MFSALLVFVFDLRYANEFKEILLKISLIKSVSDKKGEKKLLHRVGSFEETVYLMHFDCFRSGKR